MNIIINIPKNPALAIRMLLDAGFEAGIVGGCVRDVIMDKTPHDWDICTSASPDEIQAVFKDFKQLTVGLKHGTVIVIINNEELEITTYRVDGEYLDGRRPSNVSFTKNLIEDLNRRDYTQNAIFYNSLQGIVDPFNGVSDIKNKLIRCVGDADKRLQEDSLRILRGIRFASVLGFKVEESTKIAMFKNKELLENVSKERISAEFIKMLQGKNVKNTLDEFQDIIAHIIPETKPMMGFIQHSPYHNYDIWEHTLVAIDNVEGLILRLAMFFHDIGKPSCFTIDEQGIGHFYGHAKVSAEIASEIFKRMKITSVEGINRDDLKNVIELIKYHNIKIEPKKKNIRRMLSKLNGNEMQFQRLLLVKRADILAKCPHNIENRLKQIDSIKTILDEIIKEKDCTTLKSLAINGNDLISLGIPEGKEIGKILNQLLKDIINENLPNKRETLLKVVQDYIDNKPQK